MATTIKVTAIYLEDKIDDQEILQKFFATHCLEHFELIVWIRVVCRMNRN
jgi:hypothetical protein